MQLPRQGRKVQYSKICNAMVEAQALGEIKTISRTHHGEDRLPNVEKYDLGDGWRLVVQLIDGQSKHRVFAYVGAHDDCQSWLDTHIGHKFVRRESDNTLALVPVTDESMAHHIIMPPAATLTDAEILTPVFDRVPSSIWGAMGLTADCLDQMKKMTIADTLEGVLISLECLKISNEHRNFLFDVAAAALEGNWAAVEKRIELVNGMAVVIPQESLSEALQATPTNEEFITFADAEMMAEFQTLSARDRYRDWMLYLHPEQRALVSRSFNGPARIRGVSGSGKTAIAVHRAKHLAKTCGWVAMITYNRTLKDLLSQMLDDLCGAERGLIIVFTMHEFVRSVLDRYPSDFEESKPLYGAMLEDAETKALRAALLTINGETSLNSVLRAEGSEAFFKTEIDYVRTRFSRTQRVDYLSSSRRGRKIPLTETQRKSVILAVLAYEKYFRDNNICDFQACVLDALYALDKHRINWEVHCQDMPRAIVADEIQDFSQNEIRLLGAIVPKEMPDTLFLVGDGAQKVYRKSFSLKDAGVDVSGRAVILKKNYRNTRPIMEAAYTLIKDYSFDDLDSEFIDKPMAPDYPSREGEKPLLIKNTDEQTEFSWIANDIKQHVDKGAISPGEVLVLASSYKIREGLRHVLQFAGLAVSDLREDIALDNGCVKISTIESAKGLESPFVYVAGLVEGVLPPHNDTSDDEEGLHASRLYVAMTRARDRLVMTWSIKNQDGRRCLPSRYLAKIQSKCQELENRSGVLKSLDG